MSRETTGRLGNYNHRPPSADDKTESERGIDFDTPAPHPALVKMISMDEYQALVSALHTQRGALDLLRPFARCWEAWLEERVKPNTPFHNFNKFASYYLIGATENPFRDAYELLKGEDR